MSTGTNGGDRPFVHLHVHSHYSVPDGIAPVDALVRQAAALEFKTLALTDHNTLAGVVEFLEECDKCGIQPIVGCQLDTAPWPEHSSTAHLGSLVLLVESEAGYRNLTQLLTRAHAKLLDGQAPHVTHRELAARASGLIALIGAASPINHFLRPPDAASIESYLTDAVRIFGRQNIYFEVVAPASEEQRSLNQYFIQLGEFLGISVVATNDVHYVWPEDELARLFRTHQKPPPALSEKGFELGSVRRHLSSTREMRDWFAFVPQTLANANAVAERCRYRPVLRNRRLLGHDFARGLDAESHLWDVVFRYATQKYGDLSEPIKSRLNLEFDYLSRQGLANYFLLLWKIAKFVTEQRIPCLVREGPITSSLIAYVLGLTGLDPLLHKLQFQPLLTEKVVFPEVAVEVASRHLPRVLQHLEDVYGADRIARVGRYAPFQRSQMLDELCRWAGMPREKSQALIQAGAIAAGRSEPSRWPDLFRNAGRTLPPHHPSVLGFIYGRLQRLPRGLETLPNLIVLSGEPIDEIVPIAYPAGQVATTQLKAADCDALGLPRVDLRPSVPLDVLDEAVGWVRRERDRKFEIADIGLDDSETYRFLNQGRTVGIPGFEGVVVRSLLRRERPANLPELIDVKMLSLGNKASDDPALAGALIAECQLAYRCAYLKAKNPCSYYTALLTHVCHSRRRLARVLREMALEGIRLLPPDINMSSYAFTQVGERIRTGLTVVNLMGEKAAAEITSIRRGGQFQNLLDFCRRTDPRFIPHRLVENLIKAGAMDSFGLRRSQMLALLDHAVSQSRAHSAKSRETSQMEFDLPVLMSNGSDEEIEPPDLPELPLQLKLQYELQAAGHAVTTDQLEPYLELLEKGRIARAPVVLTSRLEGRDLYLAGMVLQVERAAAMDPDDIGAWVDFDGTFVAVPERLFAAHVRELRGSDPLLIGGKVIHRDEECYLKAHTIASMIKVQQQASQARRLVLDLESENRHTVRTLRQICSQFPGQTPVIATHYEGTTSRFWPRKVEFNNVTVCPPLINAVRKVLESERVQIMSQGEE